MTNLGSIHSQPQLTSRNPAAEKFYFTVSSVAAPAISTERQNCYRDMIGKISPDINALISPVRKMSFLEDYFWDAYSTKSYVVWYLQRAKNELDLARSMMDTSVATKEGYDKKEVSGACYYCFAAAENLKLASKYLNDFVDAGRYITDDQRKQLNDLRSSISSLITRTRDVANNLKSDLGGDYSYAPPHI